MTVSLPSPRECGYCSRGTGELVADDDGWMHADPADCRGLRIAGMAVDPAKLVTSARARARQRVSDRRWSALADAEMLVCGSAHLSPGDVSPIERRAITAALRGLVARRCRLAAWAAERARSGAEIESAALDAGLAAAALARWMC